MRGSLLDNLAAHLLHHLAEMHAGWAGGFTRPAIQTSKHMLNERFGDLCPAFVECAHEIDAATRGIHFTAKNAIGGTRRQTQTAVNAVQIQFILCVRHPRATLDSICPQDRRRLSSSS